MSIMVSRGGKGGKGGKKDPESKPKTLSSAPMAARGPTSPRRPESPRPQKNRKASRKPKKAKLDADREKEETQSVHDEEEMAGLSGAYGLMDSVVKVFCTHTEPNYSLPWQRKRQISSTSSGFVISTKDRQILTNAHSVEYHTQVKVKRCGSDEKHVARVLSIGIECDIAMLTVDDESFWEDLEAIEFGKLPLLQDDVCVIGFPVGGSEISVTSGVVSRVDVTSYVHGATELLSLQIDAAINSGNSGGPVFDNEGKCVGIAFQSMKNEDVENCGYVIPATVVEHFIDDYKRHSEYTGFPSIGIEWQSMENEHLRASQGMKRDQKGILVTRVSAASPAAGKIKKGDILLDFASTSIGNDGTIELRTRERISFTWLISQKFSGDKGNLSLLRDRKKLKVVVPLKPLKRLVPVHIDGRNPSYYIIAGLFFTPLNYKYLKSEYGKVSRSPSPNQP